MREAQRPLAGAIHTPDPTTTPHVASPAATQSSGVLLDVRPVPVLDADGLLRHRGRWVSIPDNQLVLVALLVRNLGRLVDTGEVRQAYEATGGSGSPTSLRSVVHRLGRRVAGVDLRLHVVRSRGLVLDVSRS